MSKTLPSSERKLENPNATELPSTAEIVAKDFMPLVPAERTPIGGEDMRDGEWIQTAQEIYRTSTDFFDANLRRVIEESMDLYRSQHPAGSKYNTPAFAKRSRLFRPKIRSSLRKKEAAVAKAFFSTSDVVICGAPDTGDKNQVLAATIQQEILNKRLNSRKMHWFATVVGAFQDAERQGFIVSRTDWDYRTADQYYTDATVEEAVALDTPMVTLIPAENIRIDPGCDWRDPINSSMYLIELMPMKVGEVKEMIRKRRGRFRYRNVDDEVLLSGLRQEWDSVRSAREGYRQDRYDYTRSAITDYETVWIHKNIVRIQGEDYVFLTVGTEHMLTDPMPLSEVDPRGYRGYEWGWTVIESHNPYPDGEVQMAKPIQEEINEVANMRADNVKMATIGRYFVRRNSQIDTEALVRFVPGSSIEMQDPQRDIKWDKPIEVNRSSYEEHNMLNSEMDDLIGVFNGASVENNRKMNETVGGMELLSDTANELSEFTVRTFSETWMVPVLEHLLDLVRIWETDDTIAKAVGAKYKVGMEAVFRALDNKGIGVSVNVGFGNTSPISRINKLRVGLGTIFGFFPMLAQQSDQAEIAREIFGALGYEDASRFLPSLASNDVDPQVKQLQEQVAMLTQMLEGKQLEMQSRERIAQLQEDTKRMLGQAKIASADQQAQLKLRLSWMVEQMKSEIATIDMKLKFEQNRQEWMGLYMQREALSHTIQMAERQFALELMDRQQALAAQEAEPQQPRIPGDVGGLIQSLRKPASGSVAGRAGAGQGEAIDVATGEPDFEGDEAGVIARGQYGKIPGAEG